MGASDQELTGRVAIVTGAGAGIAAMLAEAGAAVAEASGSRSGPVTALHLVGQPAGLAGEDGAIGRSRSRFRPARICG